MPFTEEPSEQLLSMRSMDVDRSKNTLAIQFPDSTEKVNPSRFIGKNKQFRWSDSYVHD